VKSSLTTHVISGVYALNFWPKRVSADKHKLRYCPLWGNSSHQDNHILSLVPPEGFLTHHTS